MKPDGQWRYGVAARLVVKVSNFDVGVNMTLPFIAAEAQFNRLEASAALRVEGYVGPDAAKRFPNFGAFDVETYVKLMDALTSLKDTIGADVDNIRPVRLTGSPGRLQGEVRILRISPRPTGLRHPTDASRAAQDG